MSDFLLQLANLGVESFAPSHDPSDSRASDVTTAFRDVIAAAIDHLPSSDESDEGDESTLSDASIRDDVTSGESPLEPRTPASHEESVSQDAPILFSPSVDHDTERTVVDAANEAVDVDEQQAEQTGTISDEALVSDEAQDDPGSASIATGNVKGSGPRSSISTGNSDLDVAGERTTWDERELHREQGSEEYHPDVARPQRHAAIASADRRAEWISGTAQSTDGSTAARESTSTRHELSPPRAAPARTDVLLKVDGENLKPSEPGPPSNQNPSAPDVEGAADVLKDAVVLSARRGASLSNDVVRDGSTDPRSESEIEGEVSILQADDSTDVSADLGRERSPSDDTPSNALTSADPSNDPHGEPVFAVDGSESENPADNGNLNAEAPETAETAKSSSMHLDVRSPERTDPMRPVQQRGPVSAAWLKTLMDSGIRFSTTDDGWNTLTLRLGEQDGTMTVDARREDDRISVHVAFSDPTLRATATQQIDRLEEALRSHYDMAVDLSLGDNDPSGHQDRSDGHRSSSTLVIQPELRRHVTATSAPALAMGSTYEWIG